MSLSPQRYTAEILMHFSSSRTGLGPKSPFRLWKKHELPLGKVSGKHGAKSFCLYESKKPRTEYQNNIAENATRLLLASGLLGMLLQGTRTNTRTSLKCPNSREKIFDHVNIPHHAGPVSIPVSVFVTKLKLSTQKSI